MKKLLILIVLFACSAEPHVMERPFVIVETTLGRWSKCGFDYHTYCYQDKHGWTKCFCDEIGKYHVGDTIR